MANTGVAVAAPGPQSQELMGVPTAGGRQAAKVVCVAALQGARRIVPLAAPLAALANACVVTVTTASPIAGVAESPVVVIVATYLVPEAATVCSHADGGVAYSKS